jgi:hypothetical protein
MCVPSLFRLSRHLPDGRGFVLRLRYFCMSRNLETPPIKRLDRLFENGYVTDPARKERSVTLRELSLAQLSFKNSAHVTECPT